jgi:hypothetical protein
LHGELLINLEVLKYRKVYVAVTRSVNLVTAHSAIGARGRQRESSRIYSLHVFETVRLDDAVRNARAWVANEIHTLHIFISAGSVGSSQDAKRLSGMEGKQAAHLPSMQEQLGG